MQLIFRIETVIIVFVSFGESALQKKSGCKCADIAPDGNTACTKLAQLPDWCELEWVKQSHFCQISCDRCTCRTNPYDIFASSFHKEHSKIISNGSQILPSSDSVNQSSLNKQMQNQTFYDINSFKNDRIMVLQEEYNIRLNQNEDNGHYFQFFHNNDDKNYYFTSVLTNLNKKAQNQSIYQTSRQNISVQDNFQNLDLYYGRNQTQDGGFTNYQINLGQIYSQISNHTKQFQNFSNDIQSLKSPQNIYLQNGTSTNLKNTNKSGFKTININTTDEKNNDVKINTVEAFQNTSVFYNAISKKLFDSIDSSEDNWDDCDDIISDSCNTDCGVSCTIGSVIVCVIFFLAFLCTIIFRTKCKKAYDNDIEDDNNNDNPYQRLSRDNNHLRLLRTSPLDSHSSITLTTNQQQNNGFGFQQTRRYISQQQNNLSSSSMNVQNVIARQQHQPSQSLFLLSNDLYNISEEDQRCSEIQSRVSNSNQAGASSIRKAQPGFSSISRLLQSFPSANLQERSKQGDCGICLVGLAEDIEDGDRAVVFPCFHVFHEKCAKKWVESKKGMAAKCPLCQTNLKNGKQDSVLYP